MSEYTVPLDQGDAVNWCEHHPDVVTTWDLTRLVHPNVYTAALTVPCLKCWSKEGQLA